MEKFLLGEGFSQSIYVFYQRGLIMGAKISTEHMIGVGRTCQPPNESNVRRRFIAPVR